MSAKNLICFIRFMAIFAVVVFSSSSFSESDSDVTRDFSLLLKAHVKDGDVDYQGFFDNESFERYIDYVANKKIDETTSKEEKLAFYINAYNALSIKGIVDGYSPKSFFGKVKFFYGQKYTIAGQRMNLYDFEHKIIRPLGEPRIHFALVCASYSCPKLRSEAYNVEQLDSQLTENAIDFINDQQKNTFDSDKKVARISKIFSWFKEDFIEKTSLQGYIALYVSDANVKALLLQDGFKVRHQKYDWSLNGSK